MMHFPVKDTVVMGTAWLGAIPMAIAQAAVPEWLQIIRELGSFGLIGFVVYWYATHVAPKNEQNFLAALQLQREQYLASEDRRSAERSEARKDFLEAQAKERDSMTRLADSMAKLSDSVSSLAAMTNTHVQEARAVWKVRGEMQDTRT